MNERKIYKKQLQISTLKFAVEVPEFITIALSAVFSRSIIVWMDFVESLGNLISTGCVALMSRKLTKNLQYEYNYGIGKVEAITALISESVGAVGFLMFLIVSIHQLFHIKQPSGLIGYVLLLKLIDIVVNFLFFSKQKTIRKEHESGVTDGEYMAYLGDLIFDLASFMALLIVWVTRNHPLSWYLSPIFGILIAVVLMTGNIKRVRESIEELMDVTLPEEDQLKILQVLTKYHEEYSEFHGVRSHHVGQTACIDICIRFAPEKTYEDIEKLLSCMKEDLSKTIKNSKVNFIIE